MRFSGWTVAGEEKIQKGDEGARKSSTSHSVDEEKALHLRARLKTKKKYFEELVFKKDIEVSYTVGVVR